MQKQLSNIYLPHYFLMIIILLFSINSCLEKNQSQVKSLNKKLLYIQDVNSDEGIYSGNFGDIVAFDPSTNENFILTNDKFFDVYPTFSPNLGIIIFESLRKHQTLSGLSSESNLFSLNIKDGVIDQFDTLSALRECNSSQEYTYMPVFNNEGNKLIFNKSNSLNVKQKVIYLYDFDLNKVKILNDSLISPFSFVWSIDDLKIYFSAENKKSITNTSNFIGVINTVTNEVNLILTKDGLNLTIGDAFDGFIVYTALNIFENTQELRIYDLTSNKDKVVLPVESLGMKEIRNPQFYNKTTIFFIGQSTNEYAVNIYKYDYVNKELSQITNDGREKYHLTYYQ